MKNLIKLLAVIMGLISLSLTGCNISETTTGDTDTIYFNGGDGSFSDTIYIVTEYPASIHKLKGGDTIGSYVSNIKDSDLKNGVGVKLLLSTDEMTNIAIYGDPVEGWKFDAQITITAHGSKYGYYYDYMKSKWRTVLMSEVFAIQNESTNNF